MCAGARVCCLCCMMWRGFFEWNPRDGDDGGGPCVHVWRYMTYTWWGQACVRGTVCVCVCVCVCCVCAVCGGVCGGYLGAGTGAGHISCYRKVPLRVDSRLRRVAFQAFFSRVQRDGPHRDGHRTRTRAILSPRSWRCRGPGVATRQRQNRRCGHAGAEGGMRVAGDRAG